jgi:hypothetical protein
MTNVPTFKPINPLKLLTATEEQLRQWEAEGRIKIDEVIPGADGVAYIEPVKPN